MSPDLPIDIKQHNSIGSLQHSCSETKEEVKKTPKRKRNRANLQLTAEEMVREKALLMQQYENPPECNDFDIIIERSKKRVKGDGVSKAQKTKRSFKCTYQGCNRKFSKTWNLFDHLRTHTGEKPFV